MFSRFRFKKLETECASLPRVPAPTVALCRDSELEKKRWKHSGAPGPYSCGSSGSPNPTPPGPEGLEKAAEKGADWGWGDQLLQKETKSVGFSGPVQNKAPKTRTSYNLHLVRFQSLVSESSWRILGLWAKFRFWGHGGESATLPSREVAWLEAGLSGHLRIPGSLEPVFPASWHLGFVTRNMQI